MLVTSKISQEHIHVHIGLICFINHACKQNRIYSNYHNRNNQIGVTYIIFSFFPMTLKYKHTFPLKMIFLFGLKIYTCIYMYNTRHAKDLETLR